MSFNPYTIFATRLPVLKVGHLIKIGDDMKQITVVRHNRQPITLAAGVVTDAIALNDATDETYKALHGNLKVGRIVQMQYLALTTPVNVVFRWMVEPLGSKWVEITYNNTIAAFGDPVEVDRWSYDKEQRLAYTKANGAQIIYVEMVEYEVTPYEATLRSGQVYLKILPNGQARMMKAP